MTRTAHTLHAPYDERVLSTIKKDLAHYAEHSEGHGYREQVPYGPRPITLTVRTLMNGVRTAEYHHDDLMTLLAEYCDHVATTTDLGPHDPDFLVARAALSHMMSDRDTGSSIQTWPWVHDLVDLAIMRALNTTGLRLPHGGPWDDGIFVDVTDVTSEWSLF